jgi:hypothetical protein
LCEVQEIPSDLRHTERMGWLHRLRRGRAVRGRRPGGHGSGYARPADPVGERHLAEFAAARRGVEGFVEPRTAVSDVTLLLVAHDGEWTRRPVRSVEWAHRFANQHGIPSYDAAVVGYPARMREYNKRQKLAGPRTASDGAGAAPTSE